MPFRSCFERKEANLAASLRRPATMKSTILLPAFVALFSLSVAIPLVKVDSTDNQAGWGRRQNTVDSTDNQAGWGRRQNTVDSTDNQAGWGR